jgi:hypothetical protein
MCQGEAEKLSNSSEHCQVQKVASLLAQALSSGLSLNMGSLYDHTSRLASNIPCLKGEEVWWLACCPIRRLSLAYLPWKSA